MQTTIDLHQHQSRGRRIDEFRERGMLARKDR